MLLGGRGVSVRTEMEIAEREDRLTADLLGIIRFTEGVSAKLHRVLNEAEIYQVVKEEFAKSEQYTASIVLLTDDGKSLKLAETSVAPSKLEVLEKASGLQMDVFKIELKRSSIYSQVVREEKTVQANVADIIREFLPRPLAFLITNTMGYDEKSSILTPLRKHGKVIGVFAMSSTGLYEYFIPSVENLALHISTALELAREHAQRKRAVQTLRGYHDRLGGLVEERTAEIKTVNEKLREEITARQQTEEALQAEKNKLQSVINAMEDGLTIQDRDYNIIYHNEVIRKIFGDRLGEKCYRVYEGKEELCEGCPVKKAFRDGKSHTTERKVVMPWGEVAFWENTANPIRDARGKVISCLEITRNITERKQAEEALRESQEEYKGLAESIADVFFAFDKDLRYTYWNKASEELTGISAKDALGKHLGEIFPDSDMTKKAEKFYLKALKTQKVQNFVNEYQIRGKDYFFEISAYPSEDGLSVFVKDITERKQAEDALRESEEFSSSLLANAPNPVLVIDKDTSVRYVNPAFEKLSGFSSKEAIGRKAPYLWWTEETLKKTSGDLKQAMSRGAVRLEELFKKKNGERFWVEITSAPLRKDGEYRYYLANWLDITQRKQAEQALRESEEKLQSMFESVTDGISVVDLNGAIIEANQRTVEMHGFKSREELLGRNATELVAPCDHDRIAANMREAMKQGTVRGVEYTLLRADGTEFPGELSTSILKDAAGDWVGHITIARDITKRKQAEEALEVEKNKLQSVVDAMEYGLTIQDRDYNIIYESKLQRKIFGDHVGEKCYRIYEGRETVCEGCPVEKAFKDGKSHTAERRTVAPSGEVIFWENTANPIRDARGRIVSCLEIARNITERKKAEQALADEATRRRILIDQSLDGIVVLDENAKVYEANRRFAEMLGYTPEEVRELHTWDWDKNFPPEQLLEMGRKVDEKGLHLETQHHRKDGSIIDVDISINGAMYAGQKLIFCVCRDITERKQADAALADEATRRRILIDQSRDGIVVLDENCKVYEANRHFADMLGYTHEEVTQFHVWDWEAVASREQVQEMIRTVDEAGDHFETRHRRKDGSVIDVEISTNGAMFGGQKLIFCVCRDITQRKQAEEAVRESEEKYKTLAEDSPIGIYFSDFNGTFLYGNKKAEEITGYKREELLGQSFLKLKLLAPKELSKAMKLLALNKLGKATGPDRFVLNRKDGAERIVEIRTRITTVGGKKVVLGMVEDITESKQAEEALRESQEFSSGLLESSPNPINVVNLDTSIRYVNPAFEKLTGFTLDEIRGRKAPYPWWPEGTRERILAAFKDSIERGGRRSETAHNFRKKSGERFWVEINSAPVIREGKPVYLIVSWLDVTERKRAEEKEKQLQRELYLAQRLASVGELAAGVAHEINNPLTGVLGFSQRLMRKSTDEAFSRDLEVIHGEARRAADVVQNLLTFARRRQPKKEYANINDIVQKTLELRDYALHTNNIEVVTAFASDLPQIMVDFPQIQEVFLNIILNAEQAMNEAHGRGKLIIKTREIKDYVRISLADDGPGIAPENLDKVFDPFFSTRTERGGTGLGLSACHGIVTEHGGRIYVRSKLGKGTTFFVELPLSPIEGNSVS
jgi:PAS domain S-box-containing protein